MAEILSLQGVSSGYGEAVVVEDVSFSVAEGESVALLGRNGVGKTTLLATISAGSDDFTLIAAAA